MTKAETRELARRARRYGYYQFGARLAVDCPRKCGERVETERNYGYRPVAKGKPYSEVVNGKPCEYRQESVTEALDRAVIDHLAWCGTDQAV